MDAKGQGLKLIFAVDALSTKLSGIGRYTWELTRRFMGTTQLEQIRYYRLGRWVRDPSLLLTQPARKPLLPYPQWAKNWYWSHACREQIFHSPNYFLPKYAENGVITVHDLSVLKYPETHPIERIKQFEQQLMHSLKIARHIITDTETTRQEVITYFNWPPERITAIHLGIAPTFTPRPLAELRTPLQRYGLKPGSYTLCVATIEPRKGIANLLAAYRQLPATLRMAYPLVLVGGKGWQSESIHQTIAQAQQAGWLHYLGFVDERDLPLLYAGARLFVYPSIYEGFGLPVAEAMASGVPVITANRSTLPEISAGAAQLIDPDDVDALSTAIASKLLDSTQRVSMITQGLTVATRYSWELCFQQTLAVYAQVRAT
jgi:alpha-1,3-rhamnosyl/mannosyltransferase